MATPRPASPVPSDVGRIAALMEQFQVTSLHLQFTDVMGSVKTVTVPAGQLEDAAVHGTWFDGSSVESLARTAESDMYLVPDLSTFAVLPWGEPRSARLICWAHTPDGEHYAGDPRGALKRSIERAAQLGFDYRVGPEVEFFVLGRSAKDASLLPHDGAGYFDFSTDGTVGVRAEMVAALQSLGIDVNSIHHEIAPGQHEIDLGHASAQTAADAVVTMRYALKAIAQRHDLIASFMPKPFQSESGSGMHVHQSLSHHSSGENAFYDASDEYQLSEVAKHFIAGQLHHAAGMCAVLSPLVNSYKRLGRGFEAPVFISWARTNRGALIRIPHVGRRQATRVELRSPDPACNPYLAFAVMLHCGLDGIERKLPLPAPVEESLYGFDDAELERRNVGVLPDNLSDALNALERDQVVRDALGDHLTERLLEAKRLEWNDYRRQVTPWELETYLERA